MCASAVFGVCCVCVVFAGVRIPACRYMLMCQKRQRGLKKRGQLEKKMGKTELTD